MAHLRIVAFNDVYALDNLPKLATLIAAARAGCDRLLVTLAGDFLAPSLLSSLDDGRGMVAILAAIGVTHVTFGNHEDDVPHAALLARIAELPVTWLATNVHLERPLPVRDVIEIGDVRVGLLGVVMIDPIVYRRPPFGATLEAPEPAALRETRALVADGCAWVLALTHQDADADRHLARALAGLPALVLGGHEHTPFDETIAGIRILKAGAEATHAWIVDATWAAPGPPAVRARLEPTAGYADDPAVRALVDRVLAPVRALATATLLELAPGAVLSSIGTRRQQTSLGELVCSRLRDTLHAEACVFNGGGIRAARDYRDRFTYGDLETEIPFDNELVVVALPGAVLEHAIVESRAGAPEEHGSFLQVDDRIEVAAARLVRVAGAPFDRARTYKVALVRDLCFGLDHIAPLIDFARAHPEVIPPPGGFRTPREVLVRSFAVSLCEQLGGFAALDGNHDGRTDADELAAAIARRDGGAPSHFAGEVLVKALDRDGDHAIEPGEIDEP
jgi:2',3'-cyclic-nucleotide 2'-phosphodiesterase (5'-nucleotidase family)